MSEKVPSVDYLGVNLDWPGENRLQIIMDGYLMNGRKALIHRLVYIAKLNPDLTDKKELGISYERRFRQWQNQHQGEGVTGMLLVYPKYYVHLVESSTEIITLLLRELRDTCESNTGLVVQCKILVLSSNAPTRLFNQWSSRVLNIPASRIEEYETHESVEKLVPECLTLMLKLGTYLAKQPKMKLREVMDHLHNNVPELLIPQDLIWYLLQSDDLCTPQEFLEKYDQPFEVVLDDELVWPVPSEYSLR